MGKYVMLTNLTDEGRKTLLTKPERLQEVNKEVESMGAKVLAQYAVFGPYDFVNVLDVPNDKDMARITCVLGSRGTMQTLTMSAMAVDEFIKSLK
jgi:uncharacterized protein with GYD domain